jgi:hypothetical protein
MTEEWGEHNKIDIWKHLVHSTRRFGLLWISEQIQTKELITVKEQR